MKFMKLGSKNDTFFTSETVRSVSSEVSSDLLIQVKGTTYLLHKFPMLSKCLHLQRLCSETTETPTQHIIQLPDFPGGVEAFELCAKYCYGIIITLSAYNIVPARCAAEYLQMTEEVEKGNLVHKLEVFLNSYVFQGWKDSIITLQYTNSYPSHSEDLEITSRCIEAIASKIRLSHSHSSKRCWGEDISELGIDLYWRTMIAIKSNGRLSKRLIGEALQIYAAKWLPTKKFISDIYADPTGEKTSKYRLLLESIVSLLPSEKGSVSCSFLLKLLRAGNLVSVSFWSRIELARRVGIQLEEASVKDLLIPSCSSDAIKYDVDIVMAILEQFMSQGQSPPTSPLTIKWKYVRRRRSRSAENVDIELQESRRSSSASHSSKLKVANLVDGYLLEIARDPNLTLSKMIAIAETIPDFARVHHDDLYKAIDTYLKAHPEMTKSERKCLCQVLDCKKLSMEACMHAAQNELLPLRLVVQVLFFEQSRASMASDKLRELPSNIKALLKTRTTTTNQAVEDQLSVFGHMSPKIKMSTTINKMNLDDDLDENGIVKVSKVRSFCVVPSRPRRMFSKIWSMNKNVCEKQC